MVPLLLTTLLQSLDFGRIALILRAIIDYCARTAPIHGLPGNHLFHFESRLKPHD
jgi:hypothetical protein